MTRPLALVAFIVLLSVFVVRRWNSGEPSPFDPSATTDNEQPDTLPPPAPVLASRSLSQNLPSTGQWRGKPALADLNGDGAVDLVASVRRWDHKTAGDGLHIWLGDGAGRWTPSLAGLSRVLGYGGAEVADVDGDGSPDVAFSGHDAKAHVYLNFLANDPPSWVSTTEHGVGLEALRGDVALGDFNRDGHVDLVTIGQFPRKGGVVLFVGDGTGDLTRSTEFLGELHFGAQVGLRDVDGDGHLELLAVAAQGPRVWRYDVDQGQTDFSAGLPASEVGGSDLAIDAADLDGDGFCELLVGGLPYENHAALRVFRWERNAWSDWGSGLSEHEPVYDAEFANLDAGGVPVIVAAGKFGISILRMRSPGEFTCVGRVAGTEGVLNLTSGDITGDGQDEIVFAGFGGLRVLDIELGPNSVMPPGPETPR